MSRKLGTGGLAVKFLREHGPHTAADIATKLGLDRANVSTALSNLLTSWGAVRVVGKSAWGAFVYEATQPIKAIGHRAGSITTPRKSRNKKTGSGVIAPAPYHRGAVWGASLL